MHNPFKVHALCALLVVFACMVRAADAPALFPPYRQWGDEALAAVDRDFWLPQKNLYAQKGALNPPGPSAGPAFAWDCGVQLTALAAAARLAPEKYLVRLRAYADGLQAYWIEAHGIGGYNVLPGMKDSDRYFDDNAWLALAFAETYEVTKDSKYLTRAEAAGRYVFSGEDTKLGGGLYWREAVRESKNTCTNAPAIVVALRLYQLTRNQAYLATAQRVFAWTRAHLQTPEGLFWDNIKLDGSVDKALYSYNSALMIRACSLMHAITSDARYLSEARRIAAAAATRWVRPADGAITDSGRFAHLLLEGFLAVGERDRDPRWREIGRRAVAYVHDKLRDSSGHYPGHWDRPSQNPRTEFQLLDQASVARAYWVAAGRL